MQITVIVARLLVTIWSYFKGKRMEIRRSTVTPNMFVIDEVSDKYPRNLEKDTKDKVASCNCAARYAFKDWYVVVIRISDSDRLKMNKSAMVLKFSNLIMDHKTKALPRVPTRLATPSVVHIITTCEWSRTSGVWTCGKTVGVELVEDWSSADIKCFSLFSVVS